MQCEERVYSIRWVTAAAGRQGVWSEEKVFIIRNATLVLPIESVFSTRRVASAVREEGFCSIRKSVQHKKGASVVEKQEKRKGNICGRKTGCVL